MPVSPLTRLRIHSRRTCNRLGTRYPGGDATLALVRWPQVGLSGREQATGLHFPRIFQDSKC